MRWFDPSVPTQYQLMTKAISRQFGRRLYLLQQQENYYWLKFHLPESEAVFTRGFINELNFYQSFAARQMDFLLPFQIISLTDLAQPFVDQGEGMILPHGSPFWHDPLSLSLIEISAVILACFSCVDELHQQGWIHGDLKAEHFIHYQGQLKLLDFEQAQLQDFHSTSALTATPRYMAPELFHAEPKSVQTDLYALGIVLYEWLIQSRCAARPYREWAILHCQTLKIHLPEPFSIFENLLHGLLAKQKQQRFTNLQQAKQVVMALNLSKNEHK